MENKGFDVDVSRGALLDAALAHVVFDGWSDATFRAAASEAGIAPDMARVICPRGALDLAVAYHRRGDAQMLARLAETDLSALRFRDRIALALRFRLEVSDREVVRRGVAHFALPQNAATGAGLIWGTADAVWTALGDTSQDANWYTKRGTLSGVYSATVLYWLGDQSENSAATWAFLDRRIEEVMRFEKLKSQLRENKVLAPLLAGPQRLMAAIRAPGSAPRDLPGRNRD